jgi:hypothetical protein
MEMVDKDFESFREIKLQEIEQLASISSNQKEKNKIKKMEMYLKLMSEENLNDGKKALLDVLTQELFHN